MELSKTTFLLVHAYRFVAFTFVAGMALTPALPSQTAKELIGDACYNELQQREKRTLWSYVAERHSKQVTNRNLHGFDYLLTKYMVVAVALRHIGPQCSLFALL